jgi:hypothetical protein
MYGRVHRSVWFYDNTNAFFAFIFNNNSPFNYLNPEKLEIESRPWISALTEGFNFYKKQENNH